MVNTSQIYKNPMKCLPSWGFGVHMTFYHVLPVFSIAYCIDFAIIINDGNKCLFFSYFILNPYTLIYKARKSMKTRFQGLLP